MDWRSRATEKKHRIEESIPPEWRISAPLPGDSPAMELPEASGLMSAQELAITASSATDLVRRIATGELTSVAVTTAFCKRAALAHQLVCFPFAMRRV
jgi:amidase